jgi:hypothetical protein
MKACIEFNWLRMGSSGGFLWKWHKVRGISWQVECLSASREGLCCMELVGCITLFLEKNHQVCGGNNTGSYWKQQNIIFHEICVKLFSMSSDISVCNKFYFLYYFIYNKISTTHNAVCMKCKIGMHWWYILKNIIWICVWQSGSNLPRWSIWNWLFVICKNEV